MHGNTSPFDCHAMAVLQRRFEFLRNPSILCGGVGWLVWAFLGVGWVVGFSGVLGLGFFFVIFSFFPLPNFTDFVFIPLGGEVGKIAEMSNILM